VESKLKLLKMNNSKCKSKKEKSSNNECVNCPLIELCKKLKQTKSESNEKSN
jgi:hypothetical protein